MAAPKLVDPIPESQRQAFRSIAESRSRVREENRGLVMGLLDSLDKVLGAPTRAAWQTSWGHVTRSTWEFLYGPPEKEFKTEELKKFRYPSDWIRAAYPSRKFGWVAGMVADATSDPLMLVTAGTGRAARGITSLSKKGQKALQRELSVAIASAGAVRGTTAARNIQQNITRSFMGKLEVAQVAKELAPEARELLKGGIRVAGREVPIVTPLTRELLDIAGEGAARLIPNRLKGWWHGIFINRSGDAILDAAAEQSRNVQGYLRGQLVKPARKFHSLATKALKTGGLTRPLLGRFADISENIVRNPKLINEIPEVARPVFHAFQEWFPELKKLMEEYGVHIDQVGGGLRGLLRSTTAKMERNADKAGKLRDKLVAMAEAGRQGTKSYVNAEAALEKMISDQGLFVQAANQLKMQVDKIPDYLPHSTTEAGQRAINKYSVIDAKQMTSEYMRRRFTDYEDMEKMLPLLQKLQLGPKGVSAKQIGSYIKGTGGAAMRKKVRTWAEQHGVPLTIEEVGNVIEEQGIRLLGGRPITIRQRETWVSQVLGRPGDKTTFFERDPLRLVGLAAERAVRTIGTATYYQNVTKMGKSLKKLLPDEVGVWKELPESVTRRFPALKGVHFEPSAVADIQRFYKKMTDPDEMSGFLRLLDSMQNYWKGSQTALWPAFHVRNAISNLYQNYLAGVVNPQNYVEAMRIQGLASPGGNRLFPQGLKGMTIRTVDGTVYSGEEIYQAALRNGVLPETFLREELPDNIVRSMVTSWNPLSARGFAFQGGRKIGMTIEHNARMANFIHQIKQGNDFFSASRMVKKYLFDYQDLTRIERKYLRRMIPFYTWTRKNIPLQIESLLTQPGKPSSLMTVLRSAGTGTVPEEDSLLPEYIKTQLYVRLGPNEKGEIRYLYGLGMPIEDLARIPFMPSPERYRGEPMNRRIGRSMQKNILGSLSPFLKFPLEQATSQSFYLGRPFDIVGVEQRMRLPPVFDEMPKKVKRFMGFRTKWVRGRKVYEADVSKINMLYNLPFSRLISTIGLIEDESKSTSEKLVRGLVGPNTFDLRIWEQRQRRRKLERRHQRRER